MRRRGYKVRSTASLHLRAYIAGDDSRDEAQHRFDVSSSVDRTDRRVRGGWKRDASLRGVRTLIVDSIERILRAKRLIENDRCVCNAQATVRVDQTIGKGIGCREYIEKQ